MLDQVHSLVSLGRNTLYQIVPSQQRSQKNTFKRTNSIHALFLVVNMDHQPTVYMKFKATYHVLTCPQVKHKIYKSILEKECTKRLCMQMKYKTDYKVGGRIHNSNLMTLQVQSTHAAKE